jgi:hypothetical protein
MKIETELKELQKQLAQVDLLNAVTTRDGTGGLELLLARRKTLKFKMYQEPGHRLPHIHIGHGSRRHVASYAIDPAKRLAGSFNNNYDYVIIEWISLNVASLLDLWAAIQSGEEGKISDLLATLTVIDDA